MDAKEVCGEVLKYFGGISAAEAAPVTGVPRCPGGLDTFTVERTTSLLKAAKKTDSYVKGDPLPHIVRCYPQAFAKPIATIYNRINETGTWPATWKTEHLTVIPKVPNPADLSECRNSSCTSIFSKILEGEVLIKLRGELEPDLNQYGGIPKCGVEHLLIDLWEGILAGMEGGSHAAVLLGVDYEKAFNRMEHSVCLEQLRELGASPGSLSLVRAFLENRMMRISIDGETVPAVPIVRGSPQGSVLGCLLYCATTQRLTKNIRQGARRRSGAHYFPDDSDDEAIEFWDRRGPEARQELKSFLYVDDTTLFDVVPLNQASRHISTNTTVERFEDLQLGRDFENLSKKAET